MQTESPKHVLQRELYHRFLRMYFCVFKGMNKDQGERLPQMQSHFCLKLWTFGLMFHSITDYQFKNFHCVGEKINPTSYTGLVRGWFGHSKPAGSITLSSDLIIELFFTVILLDIPCQHGAHFCKWTIHFCVYCPGIY